MRAAELSLGFAGLRAENSGKYGVLFYLSRCMNSVSLCLETPRYVRDTNAN